MDIDENVEDAGDFDHLTNILKHEPHFNPSSSDSSLANYDEDIVENLDKN